MQKKEIVTSKEIGWKIKRRRSELGISQESLAEILGVTYQQVQRYESGINRLNVEGIQLIADALSMPVSYFFEPDKTSMVAEGPSSYLPTEKGKLLGYFRKIKDSSSKDLVIQVARLAAKVNEQSSQ
ncbi:MAG: transcriptional regulator [Syntrophobacterales bacterium CG_4_8_14_3_um_filter_49_14]|nr:MAG: transcriptional regulator [Syntrophobacterales bacterium CG23_combo_of_CG06-09_8_20_14_all_48_27]PJC74387.1 MAG: transcriptional regulator [Syntrophobacterales bacterium CG_4_8_14_3_um_filter_49_14]